MECGGLPQLCYAPDCRGGGACAALSWPLASDLESANTRRKKNRTGKPRSQKRADRKAASCESESKLSHSKFRYGP
jgi:hypothetical protein